MLSITWHILLKVHSDFDKCIFIQFLAIFAAESHRCKRWF